jgi:hypothetical protein
MYSTFFTIKSSTANTPLLCCQIYWSSNLRIKSLLYKNVELKVNGPYRFAEQNVKFLMRAK